MASRQQIIKWALREMASAAKGGPTRERKVAVLGAGGGIGQPLSMLMKVRRGALLMTVVGAAPASAARRRARRGQDGHRRAPPSFLLPPRARR